MKVTELPAGRALDALVAEKVMGWRNLQPWTYGPPELVGTMSGQDPDIIPTRAADEYRVVPRYSENVGDAWKVLEKMHDGGWFFCVTQRNGLPWCSVWREDGDTFSIEGSVTDVLPVAICRAALLALGVTEIEGG